jgi:hypothetical protein
MNEARQLYQQIIGHKSLHSLATANNLRSYLLPFDGRSVEYEKLQQWGWDDAEEHFRRAITIEIGLRDIISAETII